MKMKIYSLLAPCPFTDFNVVSYRDDAHWFYRNFVDCFPPNKDYFTCNRVFRYSLKKQILSNGISC